MGQAVMETDTVHFFNLQASQQTYFESLDSNIIDSASNPTSYLVEQDGAYVLVKKEGSLYSFIKLPYNSSIINIRKFDFDQDGQKEWVIRWEESDGHSGPGGGLSESVQTLQIIDLEQLAIIFEQEVFYSNHNWHNEVGEDGEAFTRADKEC